MQADSRRKKWAAGYTALAQHIAEKLAPRILEVGSGRGQLTLPLIKTGAVPVCLDINAEELAHIPAEKIAGDAMHLPFKQESFSTVVCNFLTGWLTTEEMEKCLYEFFRVLKSNGRAIIMDMHLKAEKPEKKISIEQALPENNTFPSKKLWQVEEIESLAKETGFKIEGVEIFRWNIKFSYTEAMEQLRLWQAKKVFIQRVKPLLEQKGMELFDSFILTLEKVPE